jgi:hypothetical protein
MAGRCALAGSAVGISADGPGGARITLKKLDRAHDPTDRSAALDLLHHAAVEQRSLTGLVYDDPSAPRSTSNGTSSPSPSPPCRSPAPGRRPRPWPS